MINQRIERTKRYTGAVAVPYPDIKELTEKPGQFTGIKVKAAFHILCRATGKRRIHLEIIEAKLLREVAVEPFRTGFQTGLMQHRNNPDFDSSFSRLLQPFSPKFSVSLGATLEKFPMDVWIIHRRSNGSVKHPMDHSIPRW